MSYYVIFLTVHQERPAYVMDYSVNAGFPRSWKVLDFLGTISRSWKVLENGLGPGKSWKFECKVLKSPGNFF